MAGAEHVGGTASSEVSLTMVTIVLDASDAPGAIDDLVAALSKYVVVSRGQAGCRNIDLTASILTPGRFVVVQKWASPAAQQAHFDSPEMVELATACQALLVGPPAIDLLEGLSAHDLA